MKGLLFDKDGTLFDFQKTWGVWAGEVIDEFALDDTHAIKLAEVFDYDLPNREFNPTSPVIAGNDSSFMPRFLALRPDLAPNDVISRVKAMAKSVDIVCACDLPALFAELSRDYKLGIATNDSEGNARAQLERVGVLKFFDFVAGSDSGYGSKPEAGMCAAFAQAQNLAPEDCVMIGDTDFDFRAGRGAGMMTVGVLSGPATREELEPLADVVLDSIAEIPAWLKA